jgi:hypothetical protein
MLRLVAGQLRMLDDQPRYTSSVSIDMLGALTKPGPRRK